MSPPAASTAATRASTVAPGSMPQPTTTAPEAATCVRQSSNPAVTRAPVTAMPTGMATAGSVMICSLPEPARCAAIPVSTAAPGTSRPPAMTSTRPRSSLSPSSGKHGQGEIAQQAPVERPGLAHRVATMASGSDVTGAASSISGAAKL